MKRNAKHNFSTDFYLSNQRTREGLEKGLFRKGSTVILTHVNGEEYEFAVVGHRTLKRRGVLRVYGNVSPE